MISSLSINQQYINVGSRSLMAELMTLNVSQIYWISFKRPIKKANAAENACFSNSKDLNKNIFLGTEVLINQKHRTLQMQKVI